MIKIQKLTPPKAGEAMEAGSNYFSLVGNANDTLEDTLVVSYKTTHTLTLQSNSHTSWYLPKEAEN